MSIYNGITDYIEDDYTRNMLDDLQLAAELGKTLLERNKELENSLKQQQNVIEDQTQEIEYLTKQTAALREVNDSRLRIYEQLEVNIQDLERANHRLAVENAADRKHIKSLTANIESLELKCEQLQNNIDELSLQVEVERRKSQRAAVPQRQPVTYTRYAAANHDRNDEVDGLLPPSPDQSCTHTKKESCVSHIKSDRCKETQTTPKKVEADSTEKDSEEIEQISQLMSQLRERETQCGRDQRKITELEEQLEIMQEQHKILEKQLAQYHMKDEEIKSVQDELSSLEEVRLGQLCSKCLGNMNGDNISLSTCDDDDSSMFEALNERSQFRTSYTMDVQEYNSSSTPTSQNNSLYKDLVQKYQALLEVHRIPNKAVKQPNSLSLQEELQMSGDFNNSSTKDTDEESGHGGSMKTDKQAQKTRKAFSRTPTDFSEAETSSSGFCDETCSKSTQTDEMRLIPGSFLCTIGDGNDCIRIYDDAVSPIESRFRNRPEYRELFKEIFEVLNKASQNKSEDETPPVLDDEEAPKVPPVTPCVEQLPDFPDNCTDDTQSVLSSTMSQSSSQQEVTITENPPQMDTNPEQLQERVLTPLVKQPLDSISVQVNVRKRSSSRRKKAYAERSDSPVTHIVGSPKVTYSNKHGSGRRRKDNKSVADIWKGNTAIFYNRNVPSPTPSQDRGYKYEHAFEFKPSPASQELHRLKKLDRTYADVLRKSENQKPIPWRRQN